MEKWITWFRKGLFYICSHVIHEFEQDSFWYVQKVYISSRSVNMYRGYMWVRQLFWKGAVFTPDSPLLQATFKRYQMEHKMKQDSLEKSQADLKKLRRKSQGKNANKYENKESEVSWTETHRHVTHHVSHGFSFLDIHTHTHTHTHTQACSYVHRHNYTDTHTVISKPWHLRCIMSKPV